MKIAVSVHSSQVSQSGQFANGIMQGIILTYDLLELIGHKPILMVCGAKDEVGPEVLMKGKNYRARSFEDFCNSDDISIDITLEVGGTISEANRKILKDKFDTKIVVARLGNSLIIDTEFLLFRASPGGGAVSAYTDAVWYSPHHERTKSYLAEIFQSDAVMMPYLWEPDFIGHEFNVELSLDDVPDLVIMEPNINVVKTLIVPLCIGNHVYLDAPDSFDKLWILNGRSVQNNAFFKQNIVPNLAIVPGEADKVFFSERAKFDEVFNQKRIMIGHHWENELNYLYCEALYKGVPLVHNVDSWKEVGYYYPDCEIDKGAVQLQKAIDEFHDASQRDVSRKFLQRYSIHNKDVQEGYKKLIDNLFK